MNPSTQSTPHCSLAQKTRSTRFITFSSGVMEFWNSASKSRNSSGRKDNGLSWFHLMLSTSVQMSGGKLVLSNHDVMTVNACCQLVTLMRKILEKRHYERLSIEVVLISTSISPSPIFGRRSYQYLAGDRRCSLEASN